MKICQIPIQTYKDVAASLQSITEKELLKIYNDTYKTYPNENLCLAGGVALNCVANTRVKSDFKNLHVPPFPNDTGLAIGMVYIIGIKLKITQKKIKLLFNSKNDFLNAINKEIHLLRDF